MANILIDLTQIPSTKTGVAIYAKGFLSKLKDKSNKYYFRGDTDFQSILQDNLRLRKIMSDKQKAKYNQKVRDNFVKKVGIKLVK